ncbi:amino acid permease [Streptococcus sp. zg-JUN1979]|uniref:amino acid permease n=1 Tax=Streptococcus sp. zg-JUN1979 TaxID=3391450 RepID=UPI0039A5D7EB
MENHNFEHEGTFQREMTSRHLQMLSIGGVIGTGLFLSSGYTIMQAGPLGAIAAYLFGAIMVYLVMFSLGELSVAMPVTGSFHTYATRFISPATGFMVALMYWLCWVVALSSQFIGASQLMQRWFPNIPIWVFASLFAIIVFSLNTLSVGWFARAEDVLSSIKVYAILAFIILGSLAIFGILSIEGSTSAPLLTNITSQGLLPNGFIGFLSVMLSVNYAFSGVEMIGIAAGEAANPKEAVPKAIKSTIGLLVSFFVLTMFVLAALLPMSEAGVTEAPFVLVFDKIGIPYAADIMNVIILIAILSASTSGLYASSRMLWSLANEGMISEHLVKINKHGVPMRGMIVSMIGVFVALIASIYAETTIFLALVSIAGFAMVIVWLSIPLAQLRFRHDFLKTHSLEELDYKAPFSPVLPWITIILLIISIIGIAWDPSQRAGLYFGLPFIVLCYVYHYIRFKKW